jgi:aminopeptidase N
MLFRRFLTRIQATGDAAAREALHVVLVAALATAALTVGAPPAAAQPADGLAPTPPHPGIDVQHYAFDLALSDTTDRIRGTATVRIRFETDTLSTVRLDLVGPPGASGTSDTAGMRVQSATENGTAVGFRQARDEVRITPAAPPAAGETRTYAVQYAGVPGDGLIIGTNQHGERTFFGDNWPNRARHWLPVVDHLSDKATVSWRVTAPARYEVVANGTLEADSTAGDRRVTRWSIDRPLPPKVMVIGVADFVVDTAGVVDGVPVQSWVYPQDQSAGLRDLGQAPKILRFFEETFGPYPYEKLANVQSTTRYGGMENASSIFYSEAAVGDDESDEALIAHEIAHQWYGNTVTESDWPHLWLSEGVATYLTGLYLEDTYGAERLRSTMRQSRRAVVNFHAENPDTPLVDTTYADPAELLTLNPYRKGAWVLHMLRAAVGPDAFLEGMRTYYTRYRDRNASTADFRAVMEEVSGQDLTTFFRQWTRRPGHPVVDGTWRHDADAGECALTLRQTQDEAPFAVSVPVGVVAGEEEGPARIETVALEGRKATARFDCEAPPARLVLDPNVELLAEGRIQRRP